MEISIIIIIIIFLWAIESFFSSSVSFEHFFSSSQFDIEKTNGARRLSEDDEMENTLRCCATPICIRYPFICGPFSTIKRAISRRVDRCSLSPKQMLSIFSSDNSIYINIFIVCICVRATSLQATGYGPRTDENIEWTECTCFTFIYSGVFDSSQFHVIPWRSYRLFTLSKQVWPDWLPGWQFARRQTMAKSLSFISDLCLHSIWGDR